MRGGGRDYKAATPIVDGQTIVIAGRGVKSMKLEKDGEKFAAKELWNNPDIAVQFNTPVLKDGMIYGLTQNNQLFCVNSKDGAMAWTAPFPGSTTPESGSRAVLENGAFLMGLFGQIAPANPPPAESERPRRPGGRVGDGVAAAVGGMGLLWMPAPCCWL